MPGTFLEIEDKVSAFLELTLWSIVTSDRGRLLIFSSKTN